MFVRQHRLGQGGLVDKLAHEPTLWSACSVKALGVDHLNFDVTPSSKRADRATQTHG